MKCLIQYVGKTEWPFHQRLNKHRLDVPVPGAPQIDQHFNQAAHDFRETHNHKKQTNKVKLINRPI